MATYTAVVRVPDELMQRRMVGGFWQKFPEVKVVLTVQNQSGQSAAEVQRQLLAFVKEYFDSAERVVLTGNSIHQDRKFIDREWPELSQLLHYRMLDVSAWKLVFEGRYHKKFAKPEAHRALDDIRGSMEELTYYLRKVKA